jgi:raffinose/stachyose/melibiose transport system permease protein
VVLLDVAPDSDGQATALHGQSKSRRVTKRTLTQKWWPALFLLPGALLFLTFMATPIVVAVILSFSSWNGTGAIHLVGLTNWSALLHDSTAAAALERTGLVIAASWVLQVPMALALGVFAAGRQKYRALMVAFYFSPVLVSAAALGILWSNLLSPIGGGVQYAGVHLGLGILNNDWLGDPHLVLGTVIVLIAWEFIPFHMLLFQAGARQIPQSLYDAGAIDGIGPWQKVRFITLPMLRHTLVTSSTLNIVGSLTVFDLIYTLTRGGPGQSSTVLAIDQYLVGFSEFRFGYASTLAVILGGLGVVISLVLIRITGFGTMHSQAEGVA